MEKRQDPPDAVIEEIASILATGYLRMRNARTVQEPTCPEAEERLDSGPYPSLHRAVR
jgi:hypothetical protein